MQVTLSNAGRRFNKEWIFRNVNFTFAPKGKYAVLGPNGSGKSTLLSIILGNLTPSEGTVTYFQDTEIPVEQVYAKLGLAAPYLDLFEEFSLKEALAFHFKFKPIANGLDVNGLINILGMEKAKHKLLKHFSSGMKQRTKLAIACCSDTPLLILDEPTSNLDTEGINWYKKLMEEFSSEKTVIVGSNQAHEYEFCEEFVRITDYK